VPDKIAIPCWKITGCQKQNNCPAIMQPDTPCWELAKELKDYRSAYDVCNDCLVYLSKQKNSSLTELEIKNILNNKIDCVISENCPHYSKQI
jgi:hypothetical protein